MRTLILGGSGFIGANFVDLLLDRGLYVVSYDRDPPVVALGGVKEYALGDISDSDKISAVIVRHDITHVVHLVSTTLPSTSNLDIEFDIQSNLVSVIKILDLCVNHKIKKILYMSSGGTVYGITGEEPVDEFHATNPICSYGIVKLAIEKYLQLYHRLYGLQYSIVRAANPYGIGQRAKNGQGIIAAFVDRLLRDDPLTVWGDGTVTRDYIDVRDLVNLCELALKSELSDVYNAGSGVGVSVRQLIQNLFDCVGKSTDVNYLPARSVDVPTIVLNCDKAKSALAWTPNTPMAQGLADYVEWYKSAVAVDWGSQESF